MLWILIWFSKQTLSKHLSCPFSQPDIEGFWVRKINPNDTDLQKAFDTLDHDILLDKMKYLGFTLKLIDWFRSYFKKWSIAVSLEKTIRNKDFELRYPSMINIKSYTAFDICKRHEDSTEEL